MARRGLLRPPTPAQQRPRARGPVVPSDWPPPFSPGEVIASPTDPSDERIDVGVLIVGGVGMRCARDLVRK